MRKTLRVVALLALLYMCGVASVCAQGGAERPFITKWQGEANKKLKIPIKGEKYKLVIKNAQGEEVMNRKGVTIHSFFTFTPTEDGVYTVEAGPEGVKSMEYYDSSLSADELLEVVQFGTVKWESMERMFAGCKQMTFAADIDTPDLSNVKFMSYMFSGCSSFNQPLDSWSWIYDSYTLVDMSYMFFGCSSFNQPLNSWNVGKVQDMRNMFSGCSSFNQPLDSWDVSQVTDMKNMFQGCISFNQPLNSWNVGRVENMSCTFSGCSSFNQPLDNWDVRGVENMSSMFFGCISFNQPLNSWDVGKVQNMRNMFSGCSSFNQPLNSWSVYNVTDMSHMFSGCTAFNQPLDSWRVGNVENMSSMFSGCSSFNQPLGKWNIKTGIGGLNTTAMSPTNYSQTLVEWAEKDDIQTDINFFDNVRGLVYNNEGKIAREKLIAKGWKFEGDIYQLNGVSITPHSLSLVLNKEFTLFLDKWGVEEVEEVTLSADTEGFISYELTEDKKEIHVRGLKTGKCVLTATIAAKEGGHDAYTSTCEVNVYAPTESITITPAKKTLAFSQEKFSLTANVSPSNANEDVWWESSDPHIAQVDGKGEVSIYSYYQNGIHHYQSGNCTITAHSMEAGSTVKGTCEITVVRTVAPVESITITPKNKTLKVGETVALQSKAMPANAEQWVEWSSSAPTIATVDPTGKVTAHNVGNCTITAQSKEEGSSVKGTCEITVVENNGGNPSTFAVTLSQPEHGKLEIEGKDENALKAIPKDTELTVKVTPDEGYKLKELKAGDNDITTTQRFAVTANTTVTAVFEKKGVTPPTPQPDPNAETFAVTLSQPEHGKLEIEGKDENALKAIPKDTELIVKATPDEGYKLKELKAGDNDITTTQRFVVTANTTVTAVFEKKGVNPPTPQPDPNAETFAVTLIQPENGTLSIVGYTTETLKAVAKGTELTVKATPVEGYKLKDIVVNNQKMDGTSFKVTAATMVTAVFEKKDLGSAVEDALLSSLMVAPTPFTSQLRILNPKGVVARYELVSAAGVVVRSGVLSTTEVVIDTEALSLGIYFVRLKAQNGAKKVVKVLK